MRKTFAVIFSFLLFLIFIWCTGINYAYAETSWTKTNLNINFTTSIESTPWGILTGEMDTRLWLNPPNAIYISKDLGQSWQILGLQQRGVRDIKYFNGKIYATTYYVKDNTVGLFVSTNKGFTWNLIGPIFSPTKVNRDSQTIYLGGEHYGLWISQDEGQTWVQKIGSGGDGTYIKAIESSENITFATTVNKVYKSTDHGNTWSEVTALSPKGIVYFYINGNTIFAGSSGSEGLFLSTDGGASWHKLESFGNYAVGSITYFNKRYYVGRQNPQEQNYTVYFTSDLGSTWIDTHLDTPSFNRTLGLEWIFSEPAYLFADALNIGIYKYQIPQEQFLQLPFLNIPWQTQNENELTDKITAYFDHSYPLLGYSYFSEPSEENSSTLNFLGYKNFEPYIYYSSHSGTDFALKYGTEIIAPAAGYASYYYCSTCGNTIKIDHLNGYQSVFMHLQEDGLVTKSSQKWVNIGDKIGKVGMTGRTTGPHLHFEIDKDKNANGNFLDDYPSGRVDPYGWQNFEIQDPWKSFLWNDSLGNHQGTESIYLWNSNLQKASQFLNENTTVSLNNKRITFENLSEKFTTKITSYIQPALNYSQSGLKYLENTSFISEVFDQLGNKILDFENSVQIKISMGVGQLTNLIPESVKLYFWNDVKKIWEALPSFVDLKTGELTAYTNHFSWFAVFGEKIDKNPPVTEILVSGSQDNSWFTEFPLINLSPYDAENSQIDAIFYSINDGETWETYTEPFYLQKDGATDLLFKSQDIYENLETTKNYVILVNTQGKQTLRIKVKNATFEISAE